jgi:pyridoxamine 5'-phosphate oxidase
MASAQDERSLSEADLDPDPHQQFARWFSEAVAAGEPMPDAMALATVGVDGVPRARMMMLEEVDARGFVFQTNRESPKAAELAAHPAASLVFFWPLELRQVRVTGTISPLSRSEGAPYFWREPAGIQTMIRACKQSEVIPDRATLERAYATSLAEPTPIEVPDHWGAYRLEVNAIEFWQGRANWLQDRLRYSRQNEGWLIERLVP